EQVEDADDSLGVADVVAQPGDAHQRGGAGGDVVVGARDVRHDVDRVEHLECALGHLPRGGEDVGHRVGGGGGHRVLDRLDGRGAGDADVGLAEQRRRLVDVGAETDGNGDDGAVAQDLEVQHVGGPVGLDD